MHFETEQSYCYDVVSTGADVVQLDSKTVHYTYPFTALGALIAIAIDPSDVSNLTPSPKYAPTVKSTTHHIPNIPTTPTPGRNVTATASNGLSAGAQAGIGVGASICALVIIAFAIWTLLRRRRRATGRQEEVSTNDKPELPGKDNEKVLSELPEADRSELTGGGKPAEMESGTRHELEGRLAGT
jgi:hypothetical protein